jgi:tRNA (cytidine/uridine-2'-O-)-methyltransferase
MKGQFGAVNRNDMRRRKPESSIMRLALYQPDIPQNTGTILRLAACLGVPVDVIGPTGFDMTDRSLRRAGLDYLDHVAIARHETFDHFQAARAGRMILLSSHASVPHHEFAFAASDTLMLGRESGGVPDAVHASADARIRIPMRPGLRSLNIAVAAALVLGEALRQTGGFRAVDGS